tara:strand:+ start:657 stop:965 length:309 start_codon:yes stop_codon:yes gene_type:complete
MKLWQKAYMYFYDTWNVVMNPRYNPLKRIPSLVVQFYVTMILAIGWAVAFGLSMGWFLGIFTNVLAHVGIIFMAFFTASTFYDAERDGKVWWIDLKSQWSNK